MAHTHVTPAPLSAAPTSEPGSVTVAWQAAGSVLTLRRWVGILTGLLAASGAVLALCSQVGAAAVPLGEVVAAVWRALASGEWDAASLGPSGVIFLQIRLPRVLMGFLVGGGLALAGVALQALLRNPLADPYVLGVSSGAALGVAVAMLLGMGAILAWLPVLPLYGFAGGLLALGIIYRLARLHGRLPVHSLLLAGVILNAMLTALIMFITSIMDPNRSAGLMAWLMGSLTAPGWAALGGLIVYVMVVAVLLMRQAQALNVLTLGEETARSLGVDTERVKRHVLLLSALLTGAVVSVSGMIGFVGMVVPHMVRLLMGSDHRLLLPASALVGGMFLVLADTLARTLFAPAEFPVGIVTALMGGPFFLYLLMGRKERMV